MKTAEVLPSMQVVVDLIDASKLDIKQQRHLARVKNWIRAHDKQGVMSSKQIHRHADNVGFRQEGIAI